MAQMYLETSAHYDCAAEWLKNAIKNNILLPELPFELWRHIFSFVPQQLDICFAPVIFNPDAAKYLLKYKFTDSDSDCPGLI